MLPRLVTQRLPFDQAADVAQKIPKSMHDRLRASNVDATKISYVDSVTVAATPGAEPYVRETFASLESDEHGADLALGLKTCGAEEFYLTIYTTQPAENGERFYTEIEQPGFAHASLVHIDPLAMTLHDDGSVSDAESTTIHESRHALDARLRALADRDGRPFENLDLFDLLMKNAWERRGVAAQNEHLVRRGRTPRRYYSEQGTVQAQSFTSCEPRDPAVASIVHAYSAEADADAKAIVEIWSEIQKLEASNAPTELLDEALHQRLKSRAAAFGATAKRLRDLE